MGTSMSLPLRSLRVVAGAVLTIIEEIRASRILENPTFAEMRGARDPHHQRQGGRAPRARRREEERQEEGLQEEENIALDVEEEIRRAELPIALHADQVLDGTQETIEETYSRQTAVPDAGRRVSEAGTYLSEEATRRRLYDTPERRAAVLEMHSGGQRTPHTKSTNEGEKTFVVYSYM